MSKIDDMIAEFCPDGVEYKQLGDVCKIKNGKDYKHLGTGEIPVYGSGGIMSARVDAAAYDKPTVLLPRKGSISNVFYVDEPFWNVDTIFYTVIDTVQIAPRYLYHAMLNAHIENYSTGSAARPSLTQTALGKIEIPVPPVEVQREIVRVLDSFAKLEAELEAELEARKQQYAYYRASLLEHVTASHVFSMGELFDMKAGIHISATAISDTQNEESTIPCYGGNGLRGYVENPNQAGDALLIGRQGALCGNVCRVSGEYYATEHAVVTRCKKSILPGYAYHMLVNRDLNQYKSAGAQPGLAVGKLKEVEFHVPSLETQQRIVDILDRFGALTTSLTDGLPAEIAARRQQYEYYRDKLLTIPRKDS